MAELEGPKLGGFYTEVVLEWIAGTPLAKVQKSKEGTSSRVSRLEDLISIMYSQIQFLLPWGLYAADRLIEEEAKVRNLAYGNQVKTLAYFADAGVPSMSALRLVELDFERVDATRIARSYALAGGLNRTRQNIIGWLLSQPRSRIESSIRGDDNRRIDFDLERLLANLRRTPRQ